MKRFKLLIVVVILFGVNLFAGDFNFTGSSDSFKKSCELRAGMLNNNTLADDYSSSGITSKEYKNPGLGVTMSVLIPGAGQAYTGSWAKAVIYIGLEAFLWYNYSRNTSRGKDLEDYFHSYADEHWKEERWRTYYNPETDPSTHTLPDTKTQQYYEMIGKYDQFKQGWDDWTVDGPALTPNREYYEGIRHDSNAAFKNASYSVMIAMANHLISAFDAGFSIRKYNRSLRGDISVGLIKGGLNVVPAVSADFSFR